MPSFREQQVILKPAASEYKPQPEAHDCGGVDLLTIGRQERDRLFLGAMDGLDIRRQMGPRCQRDAIVSLDNLLVSTGIQF